MKSRSPAPYPIRSILIAGSGPKSSAYSVTSSAPVGVTISAAIGPAETGTPFSSRAVAGAGTGNVPCAHLTDAAADVERRGHDPIDTEPLHAVHGADDVDDRVERADFVQMDAFERHVVDRRLRLGQPPEQPDCAILAFPRQRRPFNRSRDVGQAVVTGVDAIVRVRRARWTRP